MCILRNSTRNKYTVISAQILQDKRLSLKDLGLLIKLLSLPDNWDFSEKGLMKILEKDGSTSIRTGLKHLEEYGYLTRETVRDEKGRITDVEWTVYETPLEKELEPELENQNSATRNSETTPQYNIKESNLNEFNTKERVKTPPKIKQVKDYIQQNKLNIDPDTFYEYYSCNGWKLGQNEVQDWQALVRLWARRSELELRNRKTYKQTNKFQNFEGRTWDFDEIEHLMLEDDDG